MRSKEIFENTQILGKNKPLETPNIPKITPEQQKFARRNLVRKERFSQLFENKGEYPLNIHQQIQAILSTQKTTDEYRASDILALRELGADIASLTLIAQGNYQQEISSANIHNGDSFIVNFGKNKFFHHRIGAGDILPPSVRTIRINGVEATRRNIPRPGYYHPKKGYMPIYDNYAIEIVEIGEPTTEDISANSAQWQSERIEDIINNNGNPLANINLDRMFLPEAQKELKIRKNIISSKFDVLNLEKGDKGLLDFIAKAEGTNDNYNAIYGNGRQDTIQFTKMTLQEILNYQKKYKKTHGSAAIGRYQFMDYTLKEMMTRYNIGADTIFSEDLQNRLALLKLHERGLARFKQNPSSPGAQKKFQLNLSKEWASIAKDDSGLSYYNGDSMNNKASKVGQQARNVLQAIYA